MTLNKAWTCLQRARSSTEKNNLRSMKRRCWAEWQQDGKKKASRKWRSCILKAEEEFKRTKRQQNSVWKGTDEARRGRGTVRGPGWLGQTLWNHGVWAKHRLALTNAKYPKASRGHQKCHPQAWPQTLSYSYSHDLSVTTLCSGSDMSFLKV